MTENYLLKHNPEDFEVEEIPALIPKLEGNYCIFWLKKRDQTTLNAINIISKQIKIPLHKIGYAGLKDRRAVTKQLCSVPENYISKLKKFSHSDIQIFIVGRYTSPVFIGDLKANKFRITVRNINKLPKEPKNFFINYFGEQRFGANNIEIGKAILKKDFEKAVELIKKSEGIIANMLGTHLESHPNDFINALKICPKKKLVIFIHAYQSYLWNNCVKQWIKSHTANRNSYFPIIGFGTEFLTEQEELILTQLEQDKLHFQSFIIREMPNLSALGTNRKIISSVSDLNVGELEEDEEFSEKKKVTIEFTLPPGSYATEYIRQMFEN